MKNLVLVFLFSLGLLSMGGAQDIINVNNTGSGAQPFFTSLQMAVDSANIGDVLHLYPTILSYGNATIDKRLTIIGQGFSISSNPTLNISSVSNNAIVGNVTFTVGSENSVIKGCSINNITIDDVDHVKIYRNLITQKAAVINSDSCSVSSCFFSGNNLGASGYDYDFHLSILNSTNIEVGYNIFGVGSSQTSNGGTNINYFDNLYYNPSSSGLINNNVFLDRSVINNATFFNNICLSTWNPLSIATSSVTHNVFSNNATLYAQDNIINAGTSGICVGYPIQGTFSFDSRYQIETGSSAEGYALMGGDCGAFSGIDPYKLSGIPNIPIVYEFNDSTQVINNGQLNINLKARKEN